MKKMITLMLALIVSFSLTGCVSNLETDRDRVASIALTYESALDGLIAARESGMLDDDAYRKVDPVLQTADKMVKLLKARVDAGETVDDAAFDRVNAFLDFLLDVLMQFDHDHPDTQSKIDEVKNLKLEINNIMRKVA